MYDRVLLNLLVTKVNRLRQQNQTRRAGTAYLDKANFMPKNINILPAICSMILFECLYILLARSNENKAATHEYQTADMEQINIMQAIPV